MSAVMHIPAPAQCPRATGPVARDISVVELASDDRLALDNSRDNVVCVADGLLYLTVGDDDVMLVGGEQIKLRAGTDVRAWNAGDEPAQVILYNPRVV